MRIVLVHGAATTAGVWERVIRQLETHGETEVIAVERPRSGVLATELAALHELARGALVVGQSGGATLALALASALPLAGAIAHEPAVGSLLPGLLAPVGAAFAAGGVAAFGATLYGPSWTPAFAGDDPEAVARELPMFRAFEPEPPLPGQGPVLVTTGELSPGIRHEAAAALHERIGYPTAVLPGASHFAAWDAPAAFAELIADTARSIRDYSPARPPSR